MSPGMKVEIRASMPIAPGDRMRGSKHLGENTDEHAYGAPRAPAQPRHGGGNMRKHAYGAPAL